MISSLSGTIRHKGLHHLVIDVSGVGYKVFVTTDVALERSLGDPIFLWTYLAVRETALDLFGFPDREMLETFELLITISGIGPKTALGILNVASPTMLRQAVANEDTSYLTKVSGIGKKNADKIVLELRDKFVIGQDDKHTDFRSEGDAMEALVSLGYSERDSRNALKQVPKEIEGAAERVKHALRILANHE
ncbi:MAG: Holliday junction branch migration protein RuvA [bacterium]